MSDKFVLSAADYAILGTMLTISASIGLYFHFFAGGQKSDDQYLLAGKNMPIYLVSFSLMATFMSATTIMGIPAEMYVFGTEMVFMNIGFLIGPVICSILFLPIYFNTGVSTPYEYLERRFGKSTRRIMSLIFLFQYILFNGVSVYGPALALSAVTNLSMWTSAISIVAVCTFYCTLGGMKAVLWTDIFQSMLMFLCLIAVVTKGCLDHGSIYNIFETAYDGGRILVPTFEVNFSTRYTMWSILLYSLILTAYSYGGNQIQVQRQLTLLNLKRSKISAVLSAPMLMAFHLLCCLCGVVIYAHFKSCDPIQSRKPPIHSPDQLMPYYITSVMRDYPGLSGLCVAGILSASLSTISSSLNSMVAVIFEDIIYPLWPKLKGNLLILKIASIFYGVLSLFMTFLIASLGNITQASILIVGMVAGPSLGVFLLASFTTTANEMGINLGMLAGFLLSGYLAFAPSNKYYPPLQVESNCSISFANTANFSTVFDYAYLTANFTNSSALQSTPKPIQAEKVSLSFMWICPLSLLVCLIVGYFGSWIIAWFRGYSESVPFVLLNPVRQWFCERDSELDNKYSKEERVQLEPFSIEKHRSEEQVNADSL